MTQKSVLGTEGENFAADYLKHQGYEVIERNYRKPWGELDIVARAPDKTLVFAEVKTMSGFGPGGLQPEDQMSRAKMGKFKKIAEFYANRKSKLVNDRKGWRLDLITLTKVGNDFLVKHYQNI